MMDSYIIFKTALHCPIPQICLKERNISSMPLAGLVLLNAIICAYFSFIAPCLKPFASLSSGYFYRLLFVCLLFSKSFLQECHESVKQLGSRPVQTLCVYFPPYIIRVFSIYPNHKLHVLDKTCCLVNFLRIADI